VRILLAGKSRAECGDREKIHECRIIYRSDAVAYPFGAEELDGLSNFFWPPISPAWMSR